MLLQLHANADVNNVRAELTKMGLWTKVLEDASGGHRSIEIVAPSPKISPHQLDHIDGIDVVLHRSSGHPLLDRQRTECNTLLGYAVDGSTPLIFAGPCSVEEESRLHRIAADVSKVGAAISTGRCL